MTDTDIERTIEEFNMEMESEEHHHESQADGFVEEEDEE